MKKIVALFMVCAMALSMSASAKKTFVFNQFQFQPHTAGWEYDSQKHQTTGYNPVFSITIPQIYKGTLKWTGWTIKYYNKNHSSKVCVNEKKLTPTLFMTICQPCIACWPCTSIPLDTAAQEINVVAPKGDPNAKPITRWNLYFVVENKKVTYIKKVDLLPLAPLFFVGSTKSIATVQSYANDGAELWLPNVQFFLAGKKDYYSIKALTAYFDGTAGMWSPLPKYEKATDTIYFAEQISKKETNYKLTSIGSYTGAMNVGTIGHLPAAVATNMEETGAKFDGYQMNGVVSLSRESSLTKKAFEAVFTTDADDSDKDSYIDDVYCLTEAPSCEEYLYDSTNADNDSFDEYLADKYKKTIGDDGIVRVDYTDTLLTLQSIFFELHIAADLGLDLDDEQDATNQDWLDYGDL